MNRSLIFRKSRLKRFQEFLKFSGIADIEMNVNELNSTYSVSVASGDFEKADNLYHVFSENELKKRFYGRRADSGWQYLQ